MRSLRLGIDVDDTLTDFVNPMIQYMRKIGIDTPDYEKTHDFDLSKTWNCTPQETVRRINLFLGSKEFENLEPIEGVREAFDILLPPHKGYPITARSKEVMQVTRNFFDAHLGGKYSQLHHLGTYHENGSKVTKAQKAIQLSLDLFVEDSPIQATEIASRGIPVLMLNRPWNVNHKVPELVTKVNSWREIVHYIRQYAS